MSPGSRAQPYERLLLFRAGMAGEPAGGVCRPSAPRSWTVPPAPVAAGSWSASNCFVFFSCRAFPESSLLGEEMSLKNHSPQVQRDSAMDTRCPAGPPICLSWEGTSSMVSDRTVPGLRICLRGLESLGESLQGTERHSGCPPLLPHQAQALGSPHTHQESACTSTETVVVWYCWLRGLPLPSACLEVPLTWRKRTRQCGPAILLSGL